jgi:hypothetical protein
MHHPEPKSEQSKTSGFITDMHGSPEHRPASSRIEVRTIEDFDLHHRHAQRSRASTCTIPN